jgi:hypothetical protein
MACGWHPGGLPLVAFGATASVIGLGFHLSANHIARRRSHGMLTRHRGVHRMAGRLSPAP